jgi:hypothetical protein
MVEAVNTFLTDTVQHDVDGVFLPRIEACRYGVHVEAVDTFLTETVQHDVDRVFLPRIEAATLSKIFYRSINFSLRHAEHAERVLMLGTVC